MNSIAKLYKITPRVLTCYKNNNPVAYLPFYEKSFITIKKAYNPTMVYYCPVVFNFTERKNPNREMLLEYEITKTMGDALWSNYRKVLLNLNPELYDIRGFKDARFIVKPHYTFVKDLKTPEGFFIDEMTKLRKAQKNDYIFSKNYNPERLLDMLYKLYSRKKHSFPIERERLLTLINDLYKADLIEQHTIMKEGKVVSSMFNILNSGNTLVAWLTATEEEDLKNGVSLLMFWNLFQTYSDRYEFYDLCGANVKGPSRVKAGMGADLKLFFQISKG